MSKRRSVTAYGPGSSNATRRESSLRTTIGLPSSEAIPLQRMGLFVEIHLKTENHVVRIAGMAVGEAQAFSKFHDVMQPILR